MTKFLKPVGMPAHGPASPKTQSQPNNLRISRSRSAASSISEINCTIARSTCKVRSSSIYSRPFGAAAANGGPATSPKPPSHSDQETESAEKTAPSFMGCDGRTVRSRSSGGQGLLERRYGFPTKRNAYDDQPRWNYKPALRLVVFPPVSKYESFAIWLVIIGASAFLCYAALVFWGPR